MKIVELLLLIAACFLFAGHASPRVVSAWNLAALGLLCTTVFTLLVFLSSAF